MKLLAASLLTFSISSFAVTAPTLKGELNLDGITTDFAKMIGIKGSLPVSVESEVDGAKAVFNGYLKEVNCIEFGPAEIPGHPETAPCLKTETRWIPEVMVKVNSVKSTLNVGNIKVKTMLGKTLRVPTSCIKDLDQAIIIGELKPMSSPSALTVNSTCTTFAYTRIEERKLRPVKLRGFSMEAIVDLIVDVKFNPNNDIVIHGDEETLLEISSVKSTIGSMFDFGGYRTRIFKYYDRVLLRVRSLN